MSISHCRRSRSVLTVLSARELEKEELHHNVHWFLSLQSSKVICHATKNGQTVLTLLCFSFLQIGKITTSFRCLSFLGNYGIVMLFVI